LLAEIFGVAAAVPVVFEFLDLVLELGSREVDGVAFFFFDVLLGFDGQHFGEPVGDLADDLADAGLGDLKFFGEAAGGEEFDEVEAVEFEVAGGGGKRREWERGRVGEGEIGHGMLLGGKRRIQKAKGRMQKAKGKVQNAESESRSVRRGVD
jgi:hypothetical protein